MLHGKDVFIGFGDMEYHCTIFSRCPGRFPFVARCNVSGIRVQGFTVKEAKKLRANALPGCELV
ncbi:MAG: hypothetical protein ABFQ53_03195 [Patescibacteria group bacterium]